jgi:hypothetical protein
MSLLESTMRVAFDGMNVFSPDAIMGCWNKGGVYDNPLIGAPARGFDAVRECMVKLCDGVKSRGEQFVVDRVTVGDTHVVAEWHVEPAHCKSGVHVTEFDGAGKLNHVRVYPRG